jgi:2-phospho-L-lactate guanylyltransferase
MKTVRLPVKDFRNAKQRLAATFSEDQRAGLARAMLADVLAVLARARAPERVIVFTACLEAAQMAAAHRFDVIREETVAGHSAAVNRAVGELSAGTASRILSIAADLPKLVPEDVDFVIREAPEPITLLHSRDGTGTNGVLFVPPAIIAMDFGPGSFSRHLSKAAAAGYRAGVLNVPGFAFDIDTPDDVRSYMQDPVAHGETWRFLTGMA